MKRIGVALLATSASLFACQRDDQAINQKLDEINKRLVAIEGKLGNAPAGAAAVRPPQQQRARPDPSAVYAVPIGSSAVVGPPTAKVTVVEAFTFT
jgi:hypothetical protein